MHKLYYWKVVLESINQFLLPTGKAGVNSVILLYRFPARVSAVRCGVRSAALRRGARLPSRPWNSSRAGSRAPWTSGGCTMTAVSSARRTSEEGTNRTKYYARRECDQWLRNLIIENKCPPESQARCPQWLRVRKLTTENRMGSTVVVPECGVMFFTNCLYILVVFSVIYRELNEYYVYM